MYIKILIKWIKMIFYRENKLHVATAYAYMG